MFSKKILVIKQTAEGYSSGMKPVCGICRLEKENDVLTVFLSLIGFSAISAGEYRLYIVGDDKTLILQNLGKIPASSAFSFRNEIDLNKGVTAGIWAVQNDIPLLVACQKSDDATLSAKEYDAAVINDIIAARKLREREKEFVMPTTPVKDEQKSELGSKNYSAKSEVSELSPILAAYNDEAVATENYFDKDKAIKQKLLCIKELSDEHIRRESDGDDSFRAQKTEKSQENLDFPENETHIIRGEVPYYLSVKSELDGIFSKFPAETTLEKAFSGSRFAKVYYAENKFYVVGLIKENGKEKYICYGVPSVYSETPPKELAGFCSFVPLSIFDLKGDGYFMMFQDAYTGKCVKKG